MHCLSKLQFQQLLDFFCWFQHHILGKFKSNDTKVLEVTETFSKDRTNGLLSALTNFRSALRQAFDGPMKAFITESVSSVKDIYLRILDSFIEGKYYYGGRKDFKTNGYNMVIWRIPVSIGLSQIGRLNVQKMCFHSCFAR